MNQTLILIYHIGNTNNMIISHKNKYIFIGLPMTGSSAISKELIEYYGGESIYMKHTNIPYLIKKTNINIKDYYVFGVYRDPTIYRLMAKGQFPKQIKLSERSSAWFTEEIYNWLETKKNIRDGGQS